VAPDGGCRRSGIPTADIPQQVVNGIAEAEIEKVGSEETEVSEHGD
jgi:hypothetical protein